MTDLSVPKVEVDAELLHDDGRQPEREFIDDQKVWIRHETTCDGEHLLLAS